MIILDSNVWVAFFNKADNQHKKAIKILKDNRVGLVVTEYILLETSSVLCLRAGKEVADKFLTMMTNNRDIKILPSDKILLDKIVKKFLDHKTKYLSFVDVSLVHFSKQYKIITFDKKLEKEIKSL